MRFWKRLLKRLGFTPAENHIFQLDQDLIASLRVLAVKEKRSPEELAGDLLYFALEQRRSAEEYIERWDSLSPREQEIAALVCLNYTNPEIAARLFISPETVKTHIRNLLMKFGFKRKVDLRRALQNWDFSTWEQKKPG